MEKEWKVGDVVSKDLYTSCAIWCNKNGAHIEKQGEDYVIVENAAPSEPSTEEQVQAKEAETGLTRAVRELVLAEGSGASDYVKQQAQEIETLAAPLRTSEKGR